jgi:uncharacterized membrane protein
MNEEIIMATQPIFQPSKARYLPTQFGSDPPKTVFQHIVDGAGDFLLEYWAHIITIVLGIIIAIAIAIPFLSYFGLESISAPLFYALHYVCAQIPSHSFYIFGHQLGLCARNFSIYSSMFIGSLVFVVSKKRLPGLPWWAWILMLLPMAIDGTTQMFGWRESDAVLRVVTGTLFGLGNVWFALPLMHKTILETTPTPVMQYSQAVSSSAPQIPQAALSALDNTQQ